MIQAFILDCDWLEKQGKNGNTRIADTELLTMLLQSLLPSIFCPPIRIEFSLDSPYSTYMHILDHISKHRYLRALTHVSWKVEAKVTKFIT
jgi:hypothetical protein